jgi:hypothetical protein
MVFSDWILVAFGAAIALSGGWIQLHPERILPRQAGRWRLDPTALAQIRLLGACFLFMGVFFSMQMTIDLKRLPWWIGTLSGLGSALAGVAAVDARRRRRVAQRSPLAGKTLELR